MIISGGQNMNNFVISILLLFFSIFSFTPVPASGDEYGGGVVAREIAKNTVTANGNPIKYLVTDRPEVTAFIVEVPSGGETGWHIHPVPVYAYIINGTLDVEMENGDIHTYREGDAIIEMVNTPHNGKNRGLATVKLVAFYTGEQGEVNTIKVQDVRRPELK